MFYRRSYRLLALHWLALFLSGVAYAEDGRRPNILWITSEDNGPDLGCYGDRYATTPNLDQLASRGLIYLHCWSTAPVCAPARTAIISGMYPSSTGSEHMRSLVRLPPGMQMGPQYLRAAGYYCTNNAKEDYNLEKPGQVWDESSNRAHWRNRKPGQPFYAVFNITVTHESQIRSRPHKAVHDPANAPVPAYHPDTPEVRQDWAQYYDKITEMDALAGDRLNELEQAGLADDTIIFYFGDHGPGMPRSKRWPYNSGLRVPLIVHVPDKFRRLAPSDYAAGGRTDRLVSFVDLAPTLMSLAGLKPADPMQGRAFMGRFAAEPHSLLHGLRGRMDERYDMVRTARDKRYVYVRNYMPHRIYGQHVAYMFQTPTTRVWKQMFDNGELNPVQSRFWQAKPPEELYDLFIDPDETMNLADSVDHQHVLVRLRAAQRAHALAIRDVGFLPEAEMHDRSRGTTPYEMGHDGEKYPAARVMNAAELASSLASDAVEELERAMGDVDSGVRFWAAQGMLMRGERAVKTTRKTLVRLLADPAPSVRVAAAEALAQHGDDDDIDQALRVLADLASFERYGLYVAIQSLGVLSALGPRAADVADVIDPFTQANQVPQRLREYIPRLLESVVPK